MEVSTPDSIRRLKKGDFIALSDERTLAAQMKAGLGLKTIDRKVNWVERIKNPLADIIICDITGERDVRRKILFAKIVDTILDVRVYDEDATFPKGNRKDLMENASLWVSESQHVFFDQPPGCDLNGLKYTDAFQLGDIVYRRKGTEDYDGEFRQSPPASGLSYPLLATVCEYSLEVGKQVNLEVPTQAMFLEVGSYESEEGGLVALWYGYEVDNAEFQVMPC